MRPGQAAGASASADAAARGERRDQSDTAGRLLGRLTVLPVLLTMAWLLAGLPLLLLGWLRPAAMLALFVPLAAAAAWLGLRWTPGQWDPGLRPPSHAPGTPRWAVLALLAVALAFGIDQAVHHSQQLIVERDPAAYVQFANWIAGHGSLPIPRDRGAFSAAAPLLRFDSSAFYQAGGAVVPQFMAGLPLLLAAGFWVGGVSAAVFVGPVLGALGVLTFGGLTARLAGPRWAPLAALALALSLPEQFTSRSAYSEPAAQILFLGGLCLVLDAMAARRTPLAPAAARVLAVLGGLALGLIVVVRIDGVSDILPLIPYCGLLLAARRPHAIPLLAGTLAGAAYGLVDGALLSRPYLASISGSLLPLAAVAAVALLVTVVVSVVIRRRGIPELPGLRRRLPAAAAVTVVVIAAGFAVRPAVQSVHGAVTPLARRVMASYQQLNHLPVDPTRLYYELSLDWVFWYIGVPAVLLGTLGAALLARRCLRGGARAWVLPLLMISWIIVTTLARPGITPDQPWASRRLVPGVLPGFLLLAAWASAWLTARLPGWLGGPLPGWLDRRLPDLLRRRARAPAAGRAVAALCALAVLVPAAGTSFALTIPGGPGGLATATTYGGEIAAVDSLCAAIPADASVVIISYSTASRMTQVIRGMCGVPTARLFLPRPGTVQATVAGIRQAGRRPVLLAAREAQLTRFGHPVRQVMALRTVGDGHTLTRPPAGTTPLRMNIWMWQPGS